MDTKQLAFNLEVKSGIGYDTGKQIDFDGNLFDYVVQPNDATVEAKQVIEYHRKT